MGIVRVLPCRGARVIRDFSRGGLYVPTAKGGAFGPDTAAAIADAANTGGLRDKALAEAYLPQRADTPTELARNIMSRWLQVASEGPGRPGIAAADGVFDEHRSPFVLTRGPPALGRAVRALAFVCADLSKERFASRGVPKLAVEPLLWTREAHQTASGESK